MRMNKFVTMALLLALAGGVTTSCSKSDDEKTPEIVDDPMKDIVEYYINGKVVGKDGNALEGVSIKSGSYTASTDASGNFKLTVSEKGEYTIEASKDGYLKYSNIKALIKNDATNRSAVNVSLSMVEKSAPVTVTVGEGASQVILTPGEQKGNISEVVSSAALIPAGNIANGSQVSMTEFVPESETTAGAGTSGNASISNIYLDTCGEDVNSEGVILVIANPVKGSASFSSLTVVKTGNSRAAEDMGTAVYDAASDTYQCTLAGGSLAGEYSFRVPYTATVSSTMTEVIKEDKVDNSGNMAAKKEVKVAYTAKAGSEYSGVSNAPSALAGYFENAIASQAGCLTSYNQDYEFTFNVNGNSIAYYKVENTYTVTTYSFSYTSGTATAEVKTYTGTKVTYTQESADQHSGGTSVN